jgi:hypothetical protein
VKLRRKPKQTRWTYGRDDWKWVDTIGCWWSPGSSPGDYFCLGDRLFHQAYGRDASHICWHGSYADDWHGGIQTDGFEEALAWLGRANGKGHSLW